MQKNQRSGQIDTLQTCSLGQRDAKAILGIDDVTRKVKEIFTKYKTKYTERFSTTEQKKKILQPYNNFECLKKYDPLKIRL